MACNAALNAIGDLADAPDGRKPVPGDPILCIHCGAVMTCDANMKLRGLTDAEMVELTADVPLMDEIARHVRQIHIVRAALN